MSGNLPASGMHANTCVAEDQGCYPVCVNPTPVCQDMLCQGCAGDGDCPAEAPYCDGSGSCMECLPDGTGCGGNTPICSLDGVCVAGCDDNNDCAEPTPICRDASYCVECNVATDCSPGEVCTPAGSCEPCTEHGQCDSGVCDELGGPGACVPVDDIVYVSNTEPGSEDMEGCGTGAIKPCQTITYAVGQAQTQDRAWIHVDAGDYTGAVTIAGGQTLRIVGEAGAGPEPAVNLEVTALASAVLDVQGAGTDVYVEGLAVHGRTFANSSVNCLGGNLRMYRSHVTGATDRGISASGCELRAERVLVNGNKGVGIYLNNAPFTVRNTVIMNNDKLAIERGNSMASQQGILEFSTIVSNNAGNDAGLSCDMPLASVSHIILSNGATSALAEVGGCFTIGTTQDDHSIIRGREMISGLAADGYHLTAGSSAVNKGGVPAPPHITEDFDGEPRPNGVIDIGADEFSPASAP